MGNMLANGSRVSDDDELKENDVKIENANDKSEPIEDYVMSEVSSLRDNFEEVDKEEEENWFHVGDFVWVEEVNSQQWWPGQIYDSSNASDLALKTMQKGKLLVVYFGDKDFAWCNQLELKPFLENFKEFSKISDSLAVEEAVREIGEQVEKFLVCDEAALVSSVAVNSGIKEGVVVVPDVRREIVSSLVLENHPGVVLDDVKSLAKTVCFSDLLEIEVLKRKVSVFYRCKGRFDLAKFDEHQYIIGLEDKEDEESCKRVLRKCSGFVKKKRKFGFGDVATTGSTTLRWKRLSEVSKIETTEEEISNGKSSSSKKRKSKSGLDDDEIEKREESNDSNHLEESEKKDDIDLATPLALVCKRLKVDVYSSVEKNNGNGETLVQTGKRERKKSKYLAPEYMTDFRRSRKIKIESAESSQVRVSERITTEKATPEEILNLIRAAALQYPQDHNSSCDMLREFVSIYRSFTYHDGANDKIHKRDLLAEVKQEVVDEEEQARNGVELFIKTDLGSTLPSKDDLIKIYKKFGALDKERSYIFDNNSFALVAFSNVSDGEEAYNKSLEKCPFATTSTITFKLKYPSSEKKEAETRKSITEIEFLKEKVEEIRALLDQSGGGVTEELKMKLEGESRNLLDKVSNMIVPSS
ncbi:PWWP domain-containing protein 6 [Cardamine amara subsp. amara]|uniref:PWWP domain-containing protein 6 n=1 Tax=Cardamine amara subsp. amara TaxID=228776 RepID=A0ABD0ZMA7_CARAN